MTRPRAIGRKRRSPQWLAIAGAVAGLALGSPLSAEIRVESGLLADAPADLNGVRAFKGIPYAAPPVGPLRWREPHPAPAWAGVRAVDRFGARCMQQPGLGNLDPLNPLMSEDCLYLNIWAPAAKAGAKLPVYVWVHGGGYNLGAGSEPYYSGARLAAKGVIVVTLNYRLNVFGFMSHPELTAESAHHASGDYGLLDQIAALQWIRKNIAAFGGDPAAVTLGGESAGAWTVNTMLMSPLAEGLFARAIAQSGGSLYHAKPDTAAISLAADAEKRGVAFEKSLGVSGLAGLRALPAERISDQMAVLGERFPPSWDGYLLPRDPKDARLATERNIPLIIGWTADEGSWFLVSQSYQTGNADFPATVRRRFGARADDVLKLYPAASPDETRLSAEALAGDERIGYPGWKWAEVERRASKAPVYRYLFDFRPPAPPISRNPIASRGAYHTSEIIYMFDNLGVRDWPFGPADREMASAMSSYWVNFIKTGNPNGGNLPAWTPLDDRQLGMEFGATIALKPLAHQDRYRLLDDISAESEKR
ncbi:MULTISPECIES: carboxylesterase/lipase family protein [unclassified Sphingomonas]|uniref:carboxylesterase/lipase family protein n=1 Tax=unclassified Sphingomonas TaxID=196159 RepID=UPI0006F821B9|nr:MULTISPECIES: carboxylesterase family protein [unclassified Sphingomonas]KQX25101.1 hypothetical protein ASD17_23820 [Sphingomonas sp. Root1294]KQY66118.1 hypothetical protein ASD39_13620 [Sphingomonas sp. Root50]KRB89716.1 hypothetical protein ASE22_18975 [Sphingomonas sp. Root720]